jgi:hypothetical protein
MRFTINSLDSGCSFALETEDADLGGFLLDSITLPFGKRPDLMKDETSMMLRINLTAHEIDAVAMSLVHMLDCREVRFFIHNIVSLKGDPCVVQDVTWFASGKIGWHLGTKAEGAGSAE